VREALRLEEALDAHRPGLADAERSLRPGRPASACSARSSPDEQLLPRRRATRHMPAIGFARATPFQLDRCLRGRADSARSPSSAGSCTATVVRRRCDRRSQARRRRALGRWEARSSPARMCSMIRRTYSRSRVGKEAPHVPARRAVHGQRRPSSSSSAVAAAGRRRPPLRSRGRGQRTSVSTTTGGSQAIGAGWGAAPSARASRRGRTTGSPRPAPTASPPLRRRRAPSRSRRTNAGRDGRARPTRAGTRPPPTPAGGGTPRAG
jgi:hypothetical protein